MKFIYTLCAFAFVGLSVAYPVDVRSNATSSLSASDNIAAVDTTNDPNTVVDGIKSDATTKAVGTGGNTKVTAASVKAAAANFANDANTVSASINTLGDTTDPKTLKSLATTAFNAESDEDAQRAVLAAAAGSAGASSNSKIVQNTPTVLTGLKNIINSPTTATASKNLAVIQKARNPNILPSITQLSNAALSAMGLPQTQQKFPATTA